MAKITSKSKKAKSVKRVSQPLPKRALPKPSSESLSLHSKTSLDFLLGKRVVITFHSLGDVDAVASAIALSRFIGPTAVIAPPDRCSAPARKLIDYMQIRTAPYSSLTISDDDLLVVVDSSSPHLLSHIGGRKIDLMIDHHTRFGGEITAKQVINDESASSTSEMLYYFLRPVDDVSCTSLMLGIIADSANFKHASSKTFFACSALLSASGKPYSEILSLSSMPERIEERIESLRSCSSVKSEKIGNYLVAFAMAKSHEAHFADLLVQMGADLAFVGCAGEDGRISARMRDSLLGKVRLDRTMFQIGRALQGSGAGHQLAAGASGKKEKLRSALNMCRKLSEKQILSSEHGKIKEIKW